MSNTIKTATIEQQTSAPSHYWGTKLRAKLNCQKSLADIKLVERDAELLSKNLEALSLYLKDNTEALKADETLSKKTQDWINDGGLDKLDGARLKVIFKKIAAHNKALMRTECVVTSAAAHDEIINSSDATITSIPRTADPKKLTFGFIRTAAKQNDKTSAQRGGLTFPIVALPNKISNVRDITIDHPLVKTLQEIYTLTNHDWLHHLTMSAVHKGVCAYEKDDRAIESWAQKHFSDSAMKYPVFDFGLHETLYEAWAVYTNAQIMKANPLGKELKDEILVKAMQMINHGKAYIEENNNSDRAMKTAYWFMLQTTKTLRNIIPVDSFEMRRFIEAAATHMPHPKRYTDEHIEHIKYKLFAGHNSMCYLQSPHLAQDESKKQKFENFTQDNAKITVEAIAHLDRKFG